MQADSRSTERISCYCAMCISHCGSIAVLENGRFVALEPDPSHPTGKAICAKGRAAPELVYHPDRLLYPMKRTRPKGDADPGWQRISWEEALDLTASSLQRIAAQHGAESVVFSVSSPSTTASDDSLVWVSRLMNAYGTPNLCASMELCGWGRFLATQYTFGASVPGNYMPDLERAGCILFWGYNPNLARLTHATATTEAVKRGARLIVVDPRRTGPAKKADVWLQVRPGTDGALALGLAQVMIERGWYDRDFIRRWTNGPLLVREDNGRLLTGSDFSAQLGARHHAAWNAQTGTPILYDAAAGTYEDETVEPALFGRFEVQTTRGKVACRPAFDLVAELCGQYPPERVEEITGIGRDRIEQAARLLWEARPVAYYAWSGIEMQTNATQTARAIAQLYALTGSLDAPGGNVLFPGVPTANLTGMELMPAGQRERALGLSDRPLGPSRWQFVTSEEVYRAVLDQQPYAVHGLVGLGANLLLAHSDTLRGREALKAVDFYVHADLFMNPTAELADVILPVASSWEREALKAGFEVTPEAQSFVQLRQKVAEPRGEARSDTEIIFELAKRLGFGAQFWDGNIEAAYREQLGPSGISLDDLRAHPGGIRVSQPVRHRKYAEQRDGSAAGFRTPSRKIELYSERMLEHGYPPLPLYDEPMVGPLSRPDLAQRYPLILTSSKSTLFCESQHRGLPSLRRQAMDPEVELHPDAAAQRGIHGGDWVRIETPEGSVRARARLNDSLKPDVICAQHGWWQACEEIGAASYDPFSAGGANLNLIISSRAVDPVSGSVPQRAYLCEIRRAE